MQTFETLLEETPGPTKPGEGQGAAADDDAGESPSLGALLDEGEPGKKPDGESRQEPVSKLFLDVAKPLGKKPEDLYALEVAIADGKTMSIGALKDIAKRETDYESAELTLETRRQKLEADHTRFRGELMEIVRALPESARNSKELRAAAEKYATRMSQARAATIASIEEWSDEKLRESELASMSKHLEERGFDSKYLDRVADPLTMKFIRDAWKLHERVKAALAKVTKAPPKKDARNTTTGNGAARPQSKSPKTSGEIGKAYSNLLD